MNTDDIQRALAKGHTINPSVIRALCDDYAKARRLLVDAKNKLETMEQVLDVADADNQALRGGWSKGWTIAAVMGSSVLGLAVGYALRVVVVG